MLTQAVGVNLYDFLFVANLGERVILACRVLNEIESLNIKP